MSVGGEGEEVSTAVCERERARGHFVHCHHIPFVSQMNIA